MDGAVALSTINPPDAQSFFSSKFWEVLGLLSVGNGADMYIRNVFHLHGGIFSLSFSM
jgi:hypothetical protein